MTTAFADLPFGISPYHADKKATPLVLKSPAVMAASQGSEAMWARQTGFEGDAGSLCLIPSDDGRIKEVWVGTGKKIPSNESPWWLAYASSHLPEGTYTLDLSRVQYADETGTITALTDSAALSTIADTAVFAWAMGQYHFTKYKASLHAAPKLMLQDGQDAHTPAAHVHAVTLVRDLINTPARDMGPAQLEDAVRSLAGHFAGAEVRSIVGDALVEQNFPAIYAVGMAASDDRAPRLIDMQWGSEGPAITLVGKGVCFDTGGLDIKPSSGMRLMKKDMGGAAHTIGLAALIMALGLKVRLRLLVPAVENAVGPKSYRPSDVIPTRSGQTVEITNTDAEGRVVLCDALTLACESKPDLIIDFATLTGAARVALGPDLPATFTNNDDMWALLDAAGRANADPLWRMPLWQPYADMLSSSIADMANASDSSFAGTITASLYLQRFIKPETPWVHFDVFGWCPHAKSGRPVGGHAQGLKASLEAIRNLFKV